jgi:hypothetical protein
MGLIKLFVQSRCPRCPQAKQVGSELTAAGFSVREYDVETPDGLAEASFYSVQATPTFIIEDREENAVADFRGVVPTAQQIREIMQSA